MTISKVGPSRVRAYVTAPSPSGRHGRPPVAAARPRRRRRLGLTIVLAIICVLWLVPVLADLVTAVRTATDVVDRGLWSLPDKLVGRNFADAWTMGDLGPSLLSSFAIAVPSVLGVLLLSSLAAYAVGVGRVRFARPAVVLLMAGSMMPAQMVATAVYRLANDMHLYDTYAALIFVHISFQLGFCTFVLTNYTSTLPRSVFEAGEIDGAGTIAIYRRILLPLLRPALAALSILTFTWIFNDYFWALVLIRSQDKLPITVGLANLQGQYNLNWTIIAAGALICIVPTIIVYLALQRHFQRGLTLGVD